MNSRLSLVNALLPLQPLHPPPKALQRALYSPAATTRAAFTSLPSAILRPKFLAQSHTFSHKLSCNARPSRLPVNPSIHPQNASNLNPLCNRNAAGQSHNSIVAVSPALTQSAIRNSAPNLLLPPCKSLHHRISCTHSRKSKATANHLCTLTNVYCLTAQPQLQDHTAPAPDATRCAHPQNFFGGSKATHEFTRQFAPIRANSILTARTDRIQSRASHEFMPRFDPLCACTPPAQLMRHSVPPAATTPAAFTQPPVCRDASNVF